MSDRVQSLLSMTSPLGADVLRPVGLRCAEAISETFTISLDMVSTEATIDPDTMLFKPVCVTLAWSQSEDLPPRYFHGLVRSFSASGGAVRDRYAYTAELVPKLWFLCQTGDCRIFQQKSTVDILKALFSDADITDVQFNISAEQSPREYTTQFNETDLAFAARLMEEEGYYYFFKHSDSGHTLIITDQNEAFADLPGAGAMRVVPAGAGADVLSAWRRVNATAIGRVSLLDYDPEKPATLPQADVSTILKTSGAAQRDQFIWPAATVKPAQVTLRARLRMEAAEATASLFEGTSRNAVLCPGGKFTLTREPATGAENVSYAVRRVTHEATDNTWVGGGGGASYQNSLGAFPAATTWRQPMVSPRPVMAGVHAALVLAPSGEEIYTEKLGRIKVRFFWDHRAEATSDQAVWVRVLHPWSGSVGSDNWGFHHLPRVGVEVAVSFMDGDPDRPVVIGSFYNGVALPIFDMTGAEKTKSGLRTRSSLKGGGSDFSEFSIDDKKGNELVYLHTQKDYTVEVEHDHTLKIDNCRMVTIKVDETVSIGGAQTITIDKGARSVTLKNKDDTLLIQKGDWSVETTLGKMSLQAKQDYTLDSKTGNISIKADAGTITIDAAQSITLKCGASTLTMDPQSITLKSPNITVKGDMSVAIESQLQASLKGALQLDLGGTMTTLKGDGMLTLKGGIMMLN